MVKNLPFADADALVQVCGGEDMADKVKKLWDEMQEKKRLDVSDQRLNDDAIQRMIKGLHMISKTSGYQTERTKPFPVTELDFSGVPGRTPRVGSGVVCLLFSGALAPCTCIYGLGSPPSR